MAKPHFTLSTEWPAGNLVFVFKNLRMGWDAAIDPDAWNTWIQGIEDRGQRGWFQPPAPETTERDRQ